MKVFLHIGTEKTGSSHLQSLASINRGLLSQYGIHYPVENTKQEVLSIKGEISAGNAQALADALNVNDLNSCNIFIKQWIQETKEKKCHTLFLSNELLVLALAKDNRLKQFKALFDKHQVDDIEMLLFLRDPIDQALSLYKHRAKNGKVPDIEAWPQENYVYGKVLNFFLKNIKEEKKIKLTTRRFSKKRGTLETILFKECLKFNANLVPPPKFVNPSLSLSELLLLKKVRPYEPFLVNLLYEKLIKIDKKNKSEDSNIEEYHKNFLSNYLVKYSETWILCNSFLLGNEQINIPETSNSMMLQSQKNSSFSDAQMEVLAEIIGNSADFTTKMQIKKAKFKTKLVKTFRLLKLKK